MSSRPEGNFNGEEGQMIQLAFSIMEVIWPCSKCQELYDHIVSKAFPDSDWQWQYNDLSTQTQDE